MSPKKSKTDRPLRMQWRVEATVPAIQWIEASSEAEAIKLACANPDGWEVDLNAPIEAEHVVEVEAEE